VEDIPSRQPEFLLKVKLPVSEIKLLIVLLLNQEEKNKLLKTNYA
jgi:hypothetical protein